MTIGSVSANVSAYSPSSTSSATSTKQLQRQINVLQQKIQAETASDDDATTKQVKIASYQAQLAVLQLQLAETQQSSSGGG